MSDSPPVDKTPPKKRRGCFFYGAITAVLCVLIFVGGFAAAIWWIQRPVEPVVLTASEKQEVQAKVEQLQPPAESSYQPGKKTISFTEHELNGLLNEHTELGEALKFEIEKDSINAHIVHTLPPDSPILAGKTLRGRAQMELVFEESRPRLVIKDVTFYGISLPNAWLGGVKDRDLINDLSGGSGADGVRFSGVESFKLEKGRIDITLDD